MRKASIGIAHRAFSPLKTILVILSALAIGAASVQAADAAKAKARGGVDPRYAAIVIDANTGKTLFESRADAARYPASLTKMMTLYLTFEALKSGKIKKTTQVQFSKNAAAEPPTKLGVRAGGSVSVETIIYSLVTKSANDSATAMGEFLGGSEQEFARMMTAKAHRLGMSGTVFRNANGLPNTAQHTTARDMATLGIALKEHFPEYYPYFSTRSFTYGKQRLANHNRLLGRVKGVDGIKTGYTRASGFNLVSSVSDGNRRIVAVVMGGTSGGARDRHMAELIKRYMPGASSKRGGALVAKSQPSPMQVLAKVLPDLSPDDDVEVAMQHPVPVARPRKPVAEAAPAVVEQAYAEPIPARMGDIEPMTTGSVRSGWAIQVASSPSKTEAKAFLAKANKQAPTVLADASGYTAIFNKDGVTYYRARFGGFESKSAAWNACGVLKKKKIACYAVQQ